MTTPIATPVRADYDEDGEAWFIVDRDGVTIFLLPREDGEEVAEARAAALNAAHEDTRRLEALLRAEHDGGVRVSVGYAVSTATVFVAGKGKLQFVRSDPREAIDAAIAATAGEEK